MEEDLLIVPSGSPESYCRLCFSEANVEPLISGTHLPPPNQLLLDLIRRHVAIRLDPGTPQCGICGACRMMLEEFQRFRERCLKCDYVLTGELRNDNGEREDEDDLEQEKMCHQCRMAFTTVAEMKTHFQVVHNLEQKYKCAQCPLKFTTAKRLELHRKIHDSEHPFRCHLCTADFKTNGLLKRHREKWHEIQRVFECLQCPRVFVTEIHLHLHTKSMHVPANLTGESLKEVPAAAPPAKKAKKRKAESNASAEVAPVPPLAPLGSIEPVVVHEPVDSIVPDVAVEPTIPKQEPFVHYPGTMPCLVYLERLDESIIPPIENYEIPVGKFYFHTRQKKVLLQEPPEELLADDELAQLYPGFVQGQNRRVYTCDICYKELQTPEGLKRHKLRHKSEYDFHCEECGRGFCDKGSLDRHLHLHTNDFPHKCDECPLGFVRPQLLAKHKERFHGPNATEQLKLHFCPICQRAFGKRTGLSNHYKQYHPEQTEPLPEDSQAQQPQQAMEVDEEGASALMVDESLLMDDKTALLGMLL
ncbi:conserved hypothetical protein [Culex quinquefasciatus]|uniref:C2H2-type domain-containing protein n=1 Tax=Culex quinquefasciatus TaxID=7176 RepID=B0W118_CULQU|nr:conserved hypothetical protein [Culex quinquefasciatus]|eukprot:XP_001842402.1 conserved hypothetical protein [Culex quinquefasciatus]